MDNALFRSKTLTSVPHADECQLDLVDTPPKAKPITDAISVIVNKDPELNEASLRMKAGGIAKIDCTSLYIAERVSKPPATQDKGLRHGRSSLRNVAVM